MDKLAAACKELRLGDIGDLATQVKYENEVQYLTDVLNLAVKKRESQRIQRLIK
ncbi:MAG TPA: hypothetical protein VFD15_06550 [Clostridia bacterium]|nr:hypothetical protein [Clostridia bacterium]